MPFTIDFYLLCRNIYFKYSNISIKEKPQHNQYENYLCK